MFNEPIKYKTFERQKSETKPIVKEFMKSLKRHSKQFDMRLSQLIQKDLEDEINKKRLEGIESKSDNAS